MSQRTVAGLLLAAGEGRRVGGPKALLTDSAGRLFVVRALAALADGGCTPVYAVVGASADEVRAQIPAEVAVVVAEGWAAGMGVSLRAGLDALADAAGNDAPRNDVPNVDAVVVMLVDTPGVTAAVVRRLIMQGAGPPATGNGSVAGRALCRAAYDGAPGHPVLLRREHWTGVRNSAQGDRGARDYLRTHATTLIECADLGVGDDIDTEDALAAWRDAETAQRQARGRRG